MTPSHNCEGCGQPVTTATLGSHQVTRTATLDPHPHPHGDLVTNGPRQGIIAVRRPHTIPRTEAFRYQEHLCPATTNKESETR